LSQLFGPGAQDAANWLIKKKVKSNQEKKKNSPLDQDYKQININADHIDSSSKSA
jgi:hypothetical protein